MSARLLLLFLFVMIETAPAQESPKIRLAPFLTGLQQPVAYVDDGSGRGFVVEQDGVIRLAENGQVQPRPFLNLKDRVSHRGNECGLLGLVFHPQFRTNGRFFVNYTAVNGGQLETIVSEFKTGPAATSVENKSERILLRFDQPWD